MPLARGRRLHLEEEQLLAAKKERVAGHADAVVDLQKLLRRFPALGRGSLAGGSAVAAAAEKKNSQSAPPAAQAFPGSFGKKWVSAEALMKSLGPDVTSRAQ